MCFQCSRRNYCTKKTARNSVETWSAFVHSLLLVLFIIFCRIIWCYLWCTNPVDRWSYMWHYSSLSRLCSRPCGTQQTGFCLKFRPPLPPSACSGTYFWFYGRAVSRQPPTLIISLRVPRSFAVDGPHFITFGTLAPASGIKCEFVGSYRCFNVILSILTYLKQRVPSIVWLLPMILCASDDIRSWNPTF